MALKKLTNTGDLKFPLCRLYLDDLVVLEELLRSMADDVTIRTDDYEADNVIELESQGQMIAAVWFVADCGRIVLRLSKCSAYITGFNETDNVSMGVVSRIAMRLSQCRRPSYRFLDRRWWCGVILFLTSASLIWAVNSNGEQAVAANITLIPLIVGVMLVPAVFVAAHLACQRYCLIHLYRRETNYGFFKRHGERLKLHLVTALITALVASPTSVLVGFLFGRGDGGGTARPEISKPEKVVFPPVGKHAMPDSSGRGVLAGQDE